MPARSPAAFAGRSGQIPEDRVAHLSKARRRSAMARSDAQGRARGRAQYASSAAPGLKRVGFSGKPASCACAGPACSRCSRRRPLAAGRATWHASLLKSGAALPRVPSRRCKPAHDGSTQRGPSLARLAAARTLAAKGSRHHSIRPEKEERGGPARMWIRTGRIQRHTLRGPRVVHISARAGPSANTRARTPRSDRPR